MTFIGAPFLPTVKTQREYASKDEYLAAREVYEASEGNCNTCVHLIRVPGPKDPNGFMVAKCGRCLCPGTTIKFHPEDPLQLACHEQRSKRKPT